MAGGRGASEQDTLSPVQGKVSEGPGVPSHREAWTLYARQTGSWMNPRAGDTGLVGVSGPGPSLGEAGEVPVPDPSCPFSPQKLKPEEGRAPGGTRLGGWLWGVILTVPGCPGTQAGQKHVLMDRSSQRDGDLI